ncbi:MAG TPA: PAS domain-containing protein, partial [Sphingobacteriaceae bacterium]
MSYPYSDDFFKAIVQNSTDLISIFDKQRTFKFASPSLEFILGYHPDELIGRSVLDYIHPDDVRAVEQAFVELVEVSQLKLTPIRFRSKSEGWKWLEATATNMLANPVIAGIVVNSKDVTARVQAEESEKRSQAYFSSLFHNTPVGVFAIDLEGSIQTTNASVVEIFKLDGKEIAGSAIANLFADTEIVEDAIRNLRSGKTSSFENRLNLENGIETDVNVRVIPVQQDAAILGGHIVIEDITSKKNDLKQLEMLSLVASKTTN